MQRVRNSMRDSGSCVPLGVPLCHLRRIYKCPRNRTSPDLCNAVVRCNPENIKAPVRRFQHSFSLYHCANCSGRAMFNVNGRAHADLAWDAVRQQGIGGSPFHKPDHVGSGVNGRQRCIVIIERMAVRYGFFRLPPNAERNVFCHGENVSKSAQAGIEKARLQKPSPNPQIKVSLRLLVVAVMIAVMTAFTRLFQFVAALLRLAAVLTVFADRIL